MQTTVKQIAMAHRLSGPADKKPGMQVNLITQKNAAVLKMAEEMLCITAMAINMSPEMYKIKSRVRCIAELRFLGALLIRQNFPLVTLHQIAYLFGGQDHSSVINGIQQAYRLIKVKDLAFLTKYEKAQAAVAAWLQKQAA
jgi:chromosomal replication initiation ATPase DnaA